jgi:tetratricopeptide (TPR) repeat protein
MVVSKKSAPNPLFKVSFGPAATWVEASKLVIPQFLPEVSPMSRTIYYQRNSAKREFLADTRSRSSVCMLLALFVSLVLCSTPRVAQAQSAQSGVEAYAEAIKQSVIAQRISGMERYLSLSSGGSLRVDALEFLIWDHMRLGHPDQSMKYARELLAIAPENPVAIAVVNQDPPPARGKRDLEKGLGTVKSAAAALEHLAKPEGMPQRNFDALRRQVATMLNGATGLWYLRAQDYADARQPLQQAVSDDPNNVPWVYGLGLALLDGKDKDEYRGYWYLARAANLTESREIAEYARRRYHDGGGQDAGWQAFVVSAAALDAPPSPAGSQHAGSAALAANSASSSPGTKPTLSAQNAERTGHPESSQTKLETASLDKSSRKKSSFGFEDTLREPERPATVARPSGPKGIAAPSEAVSLGILIETSLLTGQNRAAIISTLKDIVRNLHNRDEACILVFSDQLDFEQDLTADDQLLEEALSQIKPRSGKALLSGVSFAAGHLKRIGRNNNRILLIISDGTTSSATADTLSFRSQVSGVRIDCIGLKTPGTQERALLERIASYSGGMASFASNAQEFRAAIVAMTRNMGISVQ